MPNSVASSIAPPSRSWMSAAVTMACSTKPWVSTRTCRFLPLTFLAGVVTVRIDRGPAFFRAFHALGIDDRRGRAGLPRSLFAALHIERVMQSLQRTVVCPSDEVLVDRAPGWQVLRNRAPLTSGAEDVHHPVRHLADIDRTPVAAGLGPRNQRPDFAP